MTPPPPPPPPPPPGDTAICGRTPSAPAIKGSRWGQRSLNLPHTTVQRPGPAKYFSTRSQREYPAEPPANPGGSATSGGLVWRSRTRSPDIQEKTSWSFEADGCLIATTCFTLASSWCWFLINVFKPWFHLTEVRSPFNTHLQILLVSPFFTVPKIHKEISCRSFKYKATSV